MDQPPKRPPHSQADDNKVTPQQGEKVAAATSRDKRTEEAMQSPNVTVEGKPMKRGGDAGDPFVSWGYRSRYLIRLCLTMILVV